VPLQHTSAHVITESSRLEWSGQQLFPLCLASASMSGKLQAASEE
jgi:hypothetical protein